MGPDEKLLLRKSQFFMRLLGEPSFGSLDILLRDADDLAIPCRRPFHRVVIAEVETWGDLLARTRPHYYPEDRSEAFFVLSNLSTELFSNLGDCSVCFTTFQGRLIFWIDAESPAFTTDKLQHAAENAAQILEAEYQMVVTFSISDWFQDLFSTFSTYQDTLNLMFYFRFLSSSASVYTMSDLPQSTRRFSLGERLQVENQLLQYIRQENYDALKDLLQETCQRRFLNNAITLPAFPQRRAAFSDLMECLAIELAKDLPQLDASLQTALSVIAVAETAAEQIETIEQLIDDRASLAQASTSELSPEWVETLAQFVQNNYSDPNITVYQLAEMVHITPSYCTRMFRRHTGVSLLEYIQRQRVQAATNLLDQGCTMSFAAQRAGFTCTQTLRRTLKRY